MRDNMGKIYSFLDSAQIKETKHGRIAEHSGHQVRTYTQLIDRMAELNFYNPNLSLYFRGQTEDHKIRRAGKRETTALLPGAFREPISPDEPSSRK